MNSQNESDRIVLEMSVEEEGFDFTQSIATSLENAERELLESLKVSKKNFTPVLIDVIMDALNYKYLTQ